MHMKKVSARWVPRMLTDEQKKKRVDISRVNLQKFQADKENFLSRFVTMDETWIHHFDPETKQQSMTWKRASSPTPKKFKVSSSAGKVMASVFWDAEGIIMVEYLEKGATITGSYYADQIRRLREAIKSKRRGKLRARVLFHQDNAPAHKAAVAMAAIEEMGFELLEHPPYSNVPKLKGRENYDDWCFAAQNVLVLEGMAACIQQELSAEASAADLANDAKAKAKLVLTIDPSLYVHIKQAVSAYELWNTLRTMFDDSGYTRKISLLRNLINIRLENCETMTQYVTQIVETGQRLQGTGFKITDEWIGALMFKALGDNHLSHQLARALRSILKLIQGISAQTAENRDNFDRAKQEVDFDKNPFEYSKTIFKKERGQLLLTNEQIYDHFKSTYEVPKSVRLYADPNEQKPGIPRFDFHGIPPTLDEISIQIKKKSSKSAPGPDGIPYIVFKKCPSVRKHLTYIYDKIWSRKQIPECFGKAIFVLIPKKDRVTDPKDTRPIALTNTISKIFFSVLQTRMTRFMLSNRYFRPNHQKGFLPGISGCLEHNTLLSESLKDARKSERQITVCWIDLENAFGSIQHELMLFALRWYNFPPLVTDMIASYYSKLKFSITTKEGHSKTFSYNVGLFQGCCLSPIVFNIVINILVDKLTSNEKKWGYRFKFNNKYTESILAFADDLAILTRNPKHCQVLLDEVDRFCEWTDGLRTKPSKCHCLCLGRRSTRYTSYDPGLSLGGQCISTVTENAPFKFLGRKIDNIGRTPSLEGIVDSFLNDLNKVDSQQISNVKKAWIYDNYLTSRLNWPFLVYDFNKTLLSKSDAGVIKMLKLWLGLALTADSSALFRDRNSFGTSLKRPSELYKYLKVSKRYILGKSQDDVVTSLPKDKDAPELESMLQFHKHFMRGAQSNRVGLGSSKKVQDTDILKSFIRQDENDKYKIHAISLEMQNEWLDRRFLSKMIIIWTGRMRTNERNRYRQLDSPDFNRKCKKDNISLNLLA
nr:uncharacterized protein LOC116778294 [Danaus plexippus plexippus]